MQERADEPKVGDDVLVEGKTYRVIARIFEEKSVVMSRVTDEIRTYTLWDPTWEWDDSRRLWQATQYRLFEEIE